MTTNGCSGDSTTPPFFLALLLLQLLPNVRSQSTPPPPGYPYANFNPSIITIIVILTAALFLMAIFTIYIRRRSNDGVGTIRGAFSLRRANPAPRGLDSSVIETFPTLVYSTVKSHKIGKGALECAVCLNEYEDEETLRLIPKCDHVFHPECIDAWLENHVTCPVCRANLVPDPGQLVDENADVSVSVPETLMFPRLFDKFRSHSTGHSVVQRGENLERFTLRLPADVRKQVVKRGMVGEGSGKNGFRTNKSYRRLESLDRVVVVRSERWVLPRATSFLQRALSVRSPRVVSRDGEASASSATVSVMEDNIPLNNFGDKSC